MERKLAAILAADVVGFAGLVARDEEGTLARLEPLLRDNIGMQVEAHRGRVFKSLGDGVLAEFSSTVEALNCAIGIQKLAALDAHRSGDSESLRLRVGVSVGDVIVHGADLLGDGVNVAARLQALAEPGGIAVSGEVMAQVRGKIDLQLEDLGFKKLKDSDAPFRVYKTSHHTGEVKGLFDFDEDTLAEMLIKGGCLCGSVRFEISLPPISTGYCHCRICQKFTGSAMSAWTAFPASAVHFPAAEPRYFASSPIAERGFCPDCGSSLTYRLTKPRPAGYLVVFTANLDKPQDYAPAVHGGIESRMPWLEILDDLPRTTCAESRVLQEAWSSVGLSDPQTWGPGTKSPKVF
ncbi:MAG TPA: GFA family protein [Afifellaceae bacterium]|nr:GFA family protein [Afifellaceae bacterium]